MAKETRACWSVDQILFPRMLRRSAKVVAFRGSHLLCVMQELGFAISTERAVLECSTRIDQQLSPLLKPFDFVHGGNFSAIRRAEWSPSHAFEIQFSCL